MPWKFWKKEKVVAPAPAPPAQLAPALVMDAALTPSHLPAPPVQTPTHSLTAPTHTAAQLKAGATAEQVIDQEFQKTVAAGGRKMFKLKIAYNKKRCIGAGQCVLADPYDFGLDEKGIADLKEAGEQGGLFVKELDTESPHLALNAAKACPAMVISIFDRETGKKVAPVGRMLPEQLKNIDTFRPTTAMNDIPIIQESPILKRPELLKEK